MSRKSPACFLSSIDWRAISKNLGTPNLVLAVLDSPAAEQIDPAAKPLLDIFLESTHFKKPNAASRQEIHEQIDITAGPAGAARNRPK